jgi:hypothetical protein
VGASLAWANTFNGEQDVYYLRIGDYDCNVNGVGDATDIGVGGSPDTNGNGIPDECEDLCPCDFDNNDAYDVIDLLVILGAWNGPLGDCTGDGTTSVDDLLLILAFWGPCPAP